MASRRRRIVASVAVAVSAVAVAWTVHAQSTQTAPATMPSTGHMMQEHGEAQGSHMSGKADDPRELVQMPAMMQEHMLANMRDHLATLNTVIGDMGEGKFEAASKLLEERLGMSSLPLHQAAEMAPFFPQPMQDAGTGMHHAASRLAIALQDASVTQTFDSMRQVNAALHEVTSACVACHTSYRLR